MMSVNLLDRIKNCTFLLPPLQFVFVADYCLKPDVNMASVSQFPIYQGTDIPQIYLGLPVIPNVRIGVKGHAQTLLEVDRNTDPHKLFGED